jgi:hypothetical protein
MTETRTLDRPDNSWITAFAARSVALKELLQGAVRDAKSKVCAKAIASQSEPAALGRTGPFVRSVFKQRRKAAVIAKFKTGSDMNT